MTMQEVEVRTRAYSVARERLAEAVREVEDEIAAIKRRALGRIKRLAAHAANEKACLRSGIESAPELFRRPRTLVLHYVKVGYQKGKGKVLWADEARVVRRIHELLPTEAEALLKTRETPVKDALARLDAATLKKLGVTVEACGDEVVIRAMDGDIEKLVDALLCGMEAGDDAA